MVEYMHCNVNKLCIFWKLLWHKHMLKPLNKNNLVRFAQHYFWYWIWVICIIFIAKMSLPQHNHAGEPLFCYDDVTSCGDVFSRAVYSCDSKVRNKC